MRSVDRTRHLNNARTFAKATGQQALRIFAKATGQQASRIFAKATGQQALRTFAKATGQQALRTFAKATGQQALRFGLWALGFNHPARDGATGFEFELRSFVFAPLLCQSAAGMKGTARRGVKG